MFTSKSKILQIMRLCLFCLMLLILATPVFAAAPSVDSLKNTTWSGTYYTDYNVATAKTGTTQLKIGALNTSTNIYAGTETRTLNGVTTSGAVEITAEQYNGLLVGSIYSDETGMYQYQFDGQNLVCSYPVMDEDVELATWTLKKSTSAGSLTVSLKGLSDAKSGYSYTATFSENYFTASSTKVNSSLAKLSGLGAWSTYTVSDKSQAVSFLKKCGFDEDTIRGGNKGLFSKNGKKISARNHSTKNDNDHAVVYFGAQTLSDGSTLVAVLINGYSTGGYEWISNFLTGTGSTHMGFDRAAKEIVKLTNNYIENTLKVDRKNVKLWITGHSRGAAVTNLVAIRMINNGISRKNVYAYAFATPQYTTQAASKKYNCIINYVSPHDFVPNLVPSQKGWGFRRLGQSIEFNDKSTKTMASKYKKMTGNKYNGYTVKERKRLVNAFAKVGISKVKYTQKTWHTVLKFNAQTFAQTSIGYACTDNLLATGINNMLYYKDEPSVAVLAALLVDGEVISKKLPASHYMTTYMAWLDTLY